MIGALVVPWPHQQTAATRRQVPTATGEKPALVPSQPPTRVIGQVFHKLIAVRVLTMSRDQLLPPVPYLL